MWQFSHDHSPPKDYIFPFCYFISNKRERLAKSAKMAEFNEDCANTPISKAARLKILSMGLESVDVLADGNCFLHAARFALLQLNNKNITMVTTVATIRSEVVRFLINARMNVIMDGRTLDDMRGEMEDPAGRGVTASTSMTVGLST